jgi:hypothetical protein
MSKLNYTKGEWRQRKKFPIYVETKLKGKIIDIANCNSDDINVCSEKLDNAKLICLAPKMYEAIYALSELWTKDNFRRDAYNGVLARDKELVIYDLIDKLIETIE